jgi:hypothetical protein
LKRTDHRLKFVHLMRFQLEKETRSRTPSDPLSVLNDFVMYHSPRRSVQPASDQCPTPLVLVTVFDPPMTVPADLREEAADRRDKLKRDILIHGNVAQDRTEEDPVVVRVTDCRVSADRSFKWYVYAAISLSLTMSSSLIIATAHRRYILGAPSTLYADTFHLSWVLYQITALLCKEVLEDSDVSLDVFIRRLRNKTESKADLCWKIVTRVENAI